jgi:hypothetical protein
MHPVMLSSVFCLVVPYFSTLSLEQHDFSEKLLKIKYVDFIYKYYLKHFREISSSLYISLDVKI